MKTLLKSYKTQNYSIIEIDGKYYRGSSNKKSYWAGQAYDTLEQAQEQILIKMLQEANDRMRDIADQLEEYGWEDLGWSEKRLGDLLA